MAVIAVVGAFSVSAQDARTPVWIERVAETASGPPSDLHGTSWRWVGFTSPAESLVVPEPERYTLAFIDGDQIAIRADCNRGTASVARPSPGALSVGPLAMTRALCPPGSLSSRFARDVSRAIRYAIRGGQLHVELPNDAGVLRFTREP